MSIPNRTTSITGVFAADASTTIPATPVTGASYRDTSMTGTVVREGWAYKTIVDSSKFNQAMFEYSSVTAQIEKYGFLPWSNLTDYVAGSVCLGSNGQLYQATQDTGPSTTAYDPTTNGTVWNSIIVGVTEFLFHHFWTDYQLNRQDYLRADTFSWHSGTTYSQAYNHLVNDISGISPSTETVGSYTVTYYQATDGHKIVLANQESIVSSIYAESGVAWYYILDTTNQRFKLPIESPEREELIQIIRAKGNDTNVGFTDGTEGYGLRSRAVSASYGFLYVNKVIYGGTVGDSNGDVSNSNAPDTKLLGLTKDATKSGIVADMADASTAYKGKKYLYFYVGQYSESATEQTAGLNTELFNGKADRDLNNVTAGIDFVIETHVPTTGDSRWYRLYKSGWCEQGGVSSSGNKYDVTFLKEFTNTDYSVMCSRTMGTVSSSDTGGRAYMPETSNKTTTGMRINQQNGTNFFVSWEAKGYVVTS